MDRPFGQHFSTRSVVMGRNGAVATSQPLATQIGIETLKRGGTAVDAAIAANAALGVMEPTGGGIGGDLFAIVWDSSSRCLRGLNASGRAPAGLTLKHFSDLGLDRIPTEGPLSVSVPGAVDGWFALNGEFGRLSMADILMPAIEYAESGFPVTEVIAGYWANDVARLQRYPGFAEVFAPDGHAPAAGDVFRNPRLADTYRRLIDGGRDAFYEGDIAHAIASYMREHGGYLSYDDLAAHGSEWIEPVSTTYRGYEVWEIPPNGQGIAVLQMLNLLEAYDLAALAWDDPLRVHLLIEAKKLAFEDRARHYADPEFADVPVEALISKDYAAARRRLILDGRASRGTGYGDPQSLAAGDTVYLTTADGAGNMVSLIQSNFRGMGSGMTPGGLGFVLHNRGEAFALEPGHPNVFAPRKRPFHTIIPGFLTKDAEAVMSFGVMGADMQPQGQVQVLTNIIDLGLNVQQAGDAPRVRHDGSSDPTGTIMRDGGTVYLESGYGQRTSDTLKSYGHRVARDVDGFGGYQAIYRDAQRGVYMAASESRKDGHAAAY